jgi:hypothetical protein
MTCFLRFPRTTRRGCGALLLPTQPANNCRSSSATLFTPLFAALRTSDTYS